MTSKTKTNKAIPLGTQSKVSIALTPFHFEENKCERVAISQ